MKRLLLIGCMVALALAARAELTSLIELSVGGGWSTLGYKLSAAGRDPLQNPDLSRMTFSQSGSYTFGGHLSYGLLFHKNVGVGLGVDFSRYGSAARMSGVAQWSGVTDTDGERYDHRTNVQNWQDKQQLFMLEVPLYLHLQFPAAKRLNFTMQTGAKVCLPLMSDADYSGRLTHTGFYEPWMLTLTEVDDHGFYSSTMQSNYVLQTRTTVAVFLKAGIERALDRRRRVWFYAQVYATVHLLDAVDLPKSENASQLGWRNDSGLAQMQAAHDFMAEYQSVFNSDIVAGACKPMAIGAELGLRFHIPHPKRYDCRCWRW